MRRKNKENEKGLTAYTVNGKWLYTLQPFFLPNKHDGGRGEISIIDIRN